MPRNKLSRVCGNKWKQWDEVNMTETRTTDRKNKMGFSKSAKQINVSQATLF
jgi:hypothetical protein